MTQGREESRITSVTVSSGTGTALIPRIWAVAFRWRVIPPDEDAEYDVIVKDGAGNRILQVTDQVGSLSEETHLSLGIAASVLIEGASEDGAYSVIFDMH